MGARTFKAEVVLGDKKIRFEGPKEFVETMVAKYATSKKLEDDAKGPGASTGHDMSARGVSELELLAMKSPRGHHETVAVLAFALTEAGASEFTEEEIRRAYIRAGVRPPKVVAQALRDAKNNFDYLELAGRRGVYRLSNHGDRVVRFDLPRERTRK